MTYLRTSAAMLLVWSFSAAMLFAQADPLELIPDDALGFAVIKNLGDTAQRVGKVAAKMQLPVPDLLPLIKGFVGVDEGLDEKGGIAVALASGGEGRAWEDSSLVIIAAVTDYQKMIAGLQPDDADAKIASVTVMGSPMVVANKGKFALFAFGEKKEPLEKFLAATKNVKASVEPLAAWMADKQLALVITPTGKKVLFDTIVAALPDKAQLEKDAPADSEVLSQGAALAGVGEMFGGFKELLSAANGQITHLAIGLRIEDSAAMRLAVRVLFVPDGKLATWSKEVKVPAEGLLAGVPSGDFAIAYGGVAAKFSPEMQTVFSSFTDMGMQMMGMDEAKRKEFTELNNKLSEGKRFSSGVMGIMRPGDSLFSTALSVEHVENADKQLEITRQLYKVMQAGGKNSKTGEPLYQFNEVKVGSLNALELVTSLEAVVPGVDGADAAALPQVQGMFGKLFGTDGKITMYTAKATDTAIVSAYSKEQLVRGVEHVKTKAKGLDADDDVVKTTAMLLSGSQWVAYLSPQGLVQWIGVVFEALMGGEMQLPPFPATEPIGLAARVSQSGLDAELVLPDSVVAGIGQYIFMVGQMFQNGGAPLP